MKMMMSIRRIKQAFTTGAVIALSSVLLVVAGCGHSSGSSQQPTAVTVAITSPSTSPATVAIGQTLALAAIVTDGSGSSAKTDSAGVSWSLTCTIGGTAGTGSACGTLTGATTTAATYNAPSSPSGAVVVTVTATSVSDTSATASVTINVPAAIVITLTPTGSSNVSDGGTLSISASTTNDPANAGVTWSLTCTIGGTASTGSACGTLTGSTTTATTYNAPSSPSGAVVVTVKATSVSAPSITATHIINVPAVIAITLTPTGSSNVSDGGTLNISASTTNDPANAGVTWSLTCTIGGTASTGSACGTLTGTTTTAATYNAPSAPTGAVVVTLKATSVSNTSVTASLTINVPAVIAITLTPTGSSNVSDGGTLNISASTTNDPANAGVTWSLTCTIGGTASTGSACGTLTGTTTTATTYNAPSAPTGAVVVTLKATSVSNTSITATQIINVPAAAIVITLTPAGSSNVSDGGTLNISASTTNDPANAGVTWSLTCTIGGTASTGSACGTLTGSTTTATTYNAPSTPAGAVVVTVKATSISNTSITATQILNVPSAIVITLTPAGSSNVSDGGTLNITASTTNDPANAGVTWSLTCTIGGTASTGSACGTLTGSTTTATTYNAPSAPAGVVVATVKATSVSATSTTASLTVNVPAAVVITLTPAGSTTVPDGGTLNISSSTTNDPANAGVTWSLTCTIGGTASTGSACGTLTGSTTTATTYNAPSTPAGAVVVTVKATSISNTSITATQIINVAVAPSITITPPTSTTVNVNSNLTVNAVVTNDVSNAGLAWSLACSINGTPTTGSACGTISGQTNTVASATTTNSSITYNAPATVSNSIAVTLTATSNANALVTATQGLSVLAAPTVTINSPAANTSVTGGTTQAVSATVTNDSSTDGVTWSLTCDTGNGSVTTGSACGTVTSPANTAVNSTTTTSTFMYKAPATATDPVAVTVIASSNLVPASTATLHLLVPGSDALAVGVSPSAATVADGATQTLTGTVTNDSTNSGVTWSLSCVSNGVTSTGATCGSLSVTSNSTAPFTTVYTAPYPSNAVTVTVTAASNVSDFTSASATLSVPAAPPLTIAVTPQPISPNTTYYMLSGGALNLTAVVSNDQATPGVVWTAAAASGYTCPSSGCGTFNTPTNATSTPAAGQTTTTDTYTAPSGLSAPLEVVLTATSNSETSVTATLNVTAQIAISFSPNILGYSYAGTTTAFSQTVTVTGGVLPYTALTVDNTTLPSWVTATPNLTAGTITFTGTPPSSSTSFTAISPATSGSWANPTTLGTGTSMVSISATDSTPNQPLTATTSAPLTTYNPDEGSGTGTPVNGMMKGTYAFYGTGFENQPGTSPATASTAGYPQRVGVIGSIYADSNGNITGEIDVNDYNGYAFYNVTGSYNVQSNQLATITLLLPTTPVTPVTLVAALGGLNGGIASTGQFIEYDDLAGVSGNRVSGEMSLVTSSALSQSSSPLAGPFAFGMQGATPGSAYNSTCEATGTCGPVAGAGQIIFTSGAVTGSEDVAYGALSATETLTGSLNNSGATDAYGRMTGTITASPSGPTSWPTDYVIYSVNPSLFYFMSIDPYTTTSMVAGKAMQQITADLTSTSPTSGPLNGPFVLFGNAFAQQAILTPAAENGGMGAIFGLTATPSTSDPTTGTLASTVSGIAGALNGYTTGSTVKLNSFTAITGISYSVTTSTGRVVLSGGTFTGGTNYLGLPVLYLVDTNLGFAVTTPEAGTNAYPTGMLVFYPQTGVASGLSAGNYSVALYKPDTPDSFAENGIFSIPSAVGTTNEAYPSQMFISYTNESKSSNAGGDSLFDIVELSASDSKSTISATAAGSVSLQNGSSGVQGCNNGPGFIITSTSFVCLPSGTGTAASQEPLYAVQ